MNHTWFSKMSPWVSFLVLVLCFSFSVVSDARHRKQLPTPAVLVGMVYCDTCFHQEASKSTHSIPGATVAVECSDNDSQKPTFHEEVKTNAKGEFKAKLPLSIGKDINKIKGCSVRLMRSGSPYCVVAATATSSEIHFKSKHRGTHIFSAGFFTFKPELCNQKDSTRKDFPPALPDPPTPFLPPVGGDLLPPLPDLPAPSVVPPLVPPLPRLPGVPLLPPINNKKPSKTDKLSDQKVFGFPFFPPNPFQPPVLPPLPLVPPPPSLVPPLPFQPPPPSLFPPLPFQPPPPSLIPPLPLQPPPPPASVFPPLVPPFPTIPGLTPSPPPPPPPTFPIPLPPPIPVIPGLPPVPPSKKTTP